MPCCSRRTSWARGGNGPGGFGHGGGTGPGGAGPGGNSGSRGDSNNSKNPNVKKNHKHSGSSDDNNNGAPGDNSGKGNQPADNGPYSGSLFKGVDLSKLSDDQLDSMVSMQDSVDRAQRKIEKKKRKAARKAKRKLRRSKLPQLSGAEEAIGRILTMVSRATVNYPQTDRKSGV